MAGLAFYTLKNEERAPHQEPSSVGITKADQAYVTLTDLIGVSWASESQVIKRGDFINGTFSIDSGVLEMIYGNGVSVILEGPARYTVTGSNSGRLDFGTVVAEVPKAGHGFELDYGGDRLVDHGTQFGVRLLENDTEPEVVVFKGEVEVLNRGGKSSRLMGGHAVRKVSDKFQSIPINRDRYVRELPSRELPWQMPPVPQGERVTLEFDASELIRRSGDYRCLFKWMHGPHRLFIEQVELRHNGVLVSRDIHDGSTGLLEHTFDNFYHFEVGEEGLDDGSWTLHAVVHCTPPNTGPPLLSGSMGILFIQEIPGELPIAASYLGHWNYWHDGVDWKRVFKEDGKMELYRQGQFVALGEWTYRDGFVSILFPETQATETILLESQNTFIFIDRPYLNAIFEHR